MKLLAEDKKGKKLAEREMLNKFVMKCSALSDAKVKVKSML